MSQEKNRVLLILLLSFAVSLAASAQKITMNLQQVKLEKVFSLITKQTGLTVAYSRTIVNPERIVSVQAKDKDLSKVLDDLFAGTNVAYEIGEKKIYLKTVLRSAMNYAKWAQIFGWTETQQLSVEESCMETVFMQRNCGEARRFWWRRLQQREVL